MQKLHCRDRGSVAVEGAGGVIVIVAMLGLLFAVGMWWLAVSAARTAADSALAEARAEAGTAGGGGAVAAAVLDVRVGDALQDAEITVDRGAETVTVTVTGHAFPVPFPVTTTATGPVEQFIPDTETGTGP